MNLCPVCGRDGEPHGVACIEAPPPNGSNIVVTDPLQNKRKRNAVPEGATLLSKGKPKRIYPWTTISTADIQAKIDLGLAEESMTSALSGRVIVAQEHLSIQSVLLDVFDTEDRRTGAKEILDEESLSDILRPFLREEPKWVVHCSVTDSMVSGEWGLKSFSIGKRGYLYYEPDWGVGDPEEHQSLPILAAWEPIKDAQAFRACFLYTYERTWQEFGLPPLMGQWATGPSDIMLDTVRAVLRMQPELWWGVVERLHEEKNSPSFDQVAEASAKQTREPPEAVSRILRPYYETERGVQWDDKGKDITDYSKWQRIKTEVCRGNFTEQESRILVAAFLFIIGKDVF